MLHRVRLLLFISLLALPACSDDASAPDAGRDARLDLDAAADAKRDDLSDPDAPRDARRDEAAADTRPADTTPAPDSAPCGDPGVSLPGGVTVSPSRLIAGQSVTVRYSGALAGGSAVRLHYSFNDWSWQQPNGAPYPTAKQIVMNKVAGGWEATLPIIASAHQLDFAFTNHDASSWDNNGKGDWHRPIGGLWMGPYLTWRDNLLPATAAKRDPARSVVVNFRSWRTCKARVRYGTSPISLPQTRDEPQPGLDHHLVLEGLQPNTRYYYQVGCLDPTASCPFLDRSTTHSFRTLPAHATALKLIVLADPQDTNHVQDRWADIAQALAKPPHDDAHAVLIAGDLAGDDEPMRWRAFFRKGAPLLSRTVLVPVVGNHDTPTYGSHGDTKTFEALFATASSSGKDTYYGLRLGPLTVFALNSETAQPWVGSSDWSAPAGAQYSWLAQQLTQAKTPWTIATWHISPFDVGARHAKQNESTRTVLPLLDKRVDWVVSGHEHLYQRLRPLRYTGLSGGKPQVQPVTSYGVGPQDGVGYLLAPAAGHYPPGDELVDVTDPLRSLLAYPTSAELNGNLLKSAWVGFCVLELASKSLKLTTYELGQVQPRDSVSYSKP